ncbi:SusC/RagA family TonB-linked outer membrane protein [Niabella beijingensis]|uniref:SusC/RagA family TonB-linked outer membrane protein n=1 Tax=Niabella beijingensis TaxID=2872700 RepID=UPI001CC05386|nr:SusC/RagA family TonB-linked outer membrane protein [Niabella beijingensis]MBZ4192450.1 SusC/RagA family TonB-linked outer membrane protein [Niabella beijingensis]
MKENSNDLKLFKWAGIFMLVAGSWSANAQEAHRDTSKVTGIDKLGILDSVPVVKLPEQNDAISFAELLSGNEGIHVTESGSIGAAPQLMIRGINTVNLSAGPQIYIDGLPVKYNRSLTPFLSTYEPTRFGFLNIHDIRSVSVLKDAADLSALGGRGANGAVFLATDRGTFGGTTIDVTANTGFMRARYDIDHMDGTQFKNYLQHYLTENGATPEEVAANPVFNPALTQYNQQTDWIRMIDRPARYNDYHIKLKGGSADANYMFSIGYTGKDETLEGANFKRTTMRFNLDYHLSQKFEISNNLSYSNTGSRYLEEGTDWGIHPLFVAASKAPFLGKEAYNSEDVRTNLLADVDVLGKSNPWALVDCMKNKNEENRVDGVIAAKWHIDKTLVLNSSLSVGYYNMKESQYRPALGIVADEYRIRQNSNRNSSEFTLIWNSFLNKSGRWAPAIQYNGQLGAWVETYEDKALFGRKVNAGTDDYETLKQGVVDSASNVRFRSNLSRFYFSGNVDLWNWLYVAANVSAEGSSNFGAGGRWGLYGGGKLLLDLLDRSGPHNIALRAGFGRTGNYDVRGYYQDNLYYSVSYFGYGGVYLGNVGNENIRPEVTDAVDAGIRFSLFKKRLEVDAGYYQRVTDNLITYRNYPVELGMDPQFENSGKIASKGIELSLNAKVIDGSKFSWVVYGNASTLNNKVKKLYNGDIIRTLGNVSGIARESESIGSFYGYRIKGVFRSAAEVNLKKSDGTDYKPGDYIIEDINGDGKINANDRQVIGSPLPDLFGGFGSYWSYKRLSLEARFTFSYGQDIYNSFNQQMHLMSDYSNQSTAVAGRWQSESAPGDGKLSRAAYGDPSFNGVASDLWVENGSYTRLKLLTLSYDVPLKKNASFIKGLKVNITGENLFTFTSYSGLDPEVVAASDVLLRGIDFGASPLPRSLIVGVKISL